MNCRLCYGSEIYQLNGKKAPYNADKAVASLVCSSCIQKLFGTSQENLKEAYRKAMETGCADKAENLKSFMEHEEHVQETGKTRSNMVRERPMHKVRSSRHQLRA